MKMLLAAVIVFPASWAALPSAPPRLIITPPPERDYSACAKIVPRGAGAIWETAKRVHGVRAAADLDRLGDAPAVVIDAKLGGQRLAGDRVSGLCFEGGDLTRTDWRGVRAETVGFGGSDLSDAVMTGARLRRVVFRKTILDGVDATKADLSDSRIEGGSFDGLVLRDARMRRFGLRCGLTSGDDNCEWPEKRGVDARGADLTGAALRVYMTHDWHFDGAVLDGTTVQSIRSSHSDPQWCVDR